MKTIILFLLLTATASAQFPMVAAWNGDSFDPITLDSIKYAFEADRLGVTKANGDSTYIFKNRASTGQSHDLYQLTSAQKPVYVDSSGVKFIRFDGVDDGMVATGLVYAQPTTMILVARYRLYGSSANPVFLSGRSATRQAIYDAGATDGIFAGTATNTTIANTDSVSFYAVQFNGASSYYQRNGNRKAGINPGAGGIEGLTMGRDYNATADCSIDVFAFYLYGRLITDDELTRIRLYAQSKYGTP